MTFRKFSKRAIVTSLFLGVVFASTVAFASWLATGSGTGYAKARSAVPLGTTSGSIGGSTLYPGANADVYITISNPNPYPVTVTSVTGNGTIVTGDSNSTCDASTGVTFTDQTGLNILVAAGGTQGATLSGAAHMSGSSDNTCQGETFNIPVSISGSSN
ncbi:MAG TPA: hypothetical protein VK646_03010 [Actinomycetota bacterium]|nr:hypothetical protein [Actinomycetota bacterium]